MDFRLPNLGEGIDAATVTAVLVKPGDAIKAGQNVVSVETDKAAVDVPAESDGTVESVLVKAGDKIPAGAVLLKMNAGSTETLETSSSPASGPQASGPQASGPRERAVPEPSGAPNEQPPSRGPLA